MKMELQKMWVRLTEIIFNNHNNGEAAAWENLICHPAGLNFEANGGELVKTKMIYFFRGDIGSLYKPFVPQISKSLTNELQITASLHEQEQLFLKTGTHPLLALI